MNKLNQLADWVERQSCTVEESDYLAALLRAASAETVGHIWDLAAARLAVAAARKDAMRYADESNLNAEARSKAEAERDAARKERDEAEKRCGELNDSLFQHLMEKQKIAAERDALQRERDEAVRVLDAANDSNDRLRAAINRLEQAELSALAELDEANAKRDALRRELDAALEQQQGHACAMATLAEERDALQRAIDEAYTRWLLSSEMSTTSDSMARVLCPHATRREGQQVSIDIPDFSPIMRGSKAATVAQNATPDRDKSPDTVSGSPVPTRELVARLAEVVRGVMFFKASQDEIDAIIADAKGGAE